MSSSTFCNLHVVIDTPLFAHWKKDMANVTKAVKEITEDVNIIYKNNGFGLQFQVGKITVGKDVCSVSSCPDISSLLNSFSVFANGSDFCLHYLFTYRLVIGFRVSKARNMLYNIPETLLLGLLGLPGKELFAEIFTIPSCRVI